MRYSGFLLLLAPFLFAIYCGCSETTNPVDEKSEITLPPDLKDLGVCKIGMNVKIGESCTYTANGEKITFWIDPEGIGCEFGAQDITTEINLGLLGDADVDGELNVKNCSEIGIGITTPFGNLNSPFSSEFSAEPNDDKSWTILDVP